MALHGKTPGKIREAVKSLKPFHIGNVSGQTRVGDYGRLPGEYASALRADDAAGRVKYVLYSYATPMAWLSVDDLGREHWTIPSVKYSISTSGHQRVFADAMLAQVEESAKAVMV